MPKNHYVPKVYLKQFADANGTIGHMSFNSGEIRTVPYKDQCQKKNLHNAIDKVFGYFESKIEPIFLKLLKNFNRQDLTNDELYNLYCFILLQESRTLKPKEASNKFSNTLIKDLMIKEIRLGKRLSSMMEEDVENLHINNDGQHSKAILNSLFAPVLIEDLRWHLVINENQKHDFIFSDNPIVLHNEFLRKYEPIGNTGLQRPGLIILVPINPKTYFVIYDQVTYKMKGKDNIFYLYKKSDIELLNIMQILNCHQSIYFNPTQDSERLKTMLMDVKNFKIPLDKNIGVFGTEDDTLFIHSKPNINYEFRPSFFTVNKIDPPFPFIRSQNRMEEFERACDEAFGKK
jgi:hypothetical protein